MDYQSSMLTSLSSVRSVWVQCESKIQLTRELRKFVDLYDVNSNDLESTSHGSQISNLSFRSLLIGMGSFKLVIDTLGESISQGLAENCPGNFGLPDDNYPSWLAYKGEGSSVPFHVPEDSDCRMKGIILCVVCSSTSENITDCLTSVLIANHTKCIFKIYKRDTAMSFNDEDWKGLTSNLEPGDNMEIFVAFERGVVVRVTAAYLIYGHLVTTETETSIIVKKEPSREENSQPSPNVKMELSPNMKMEPSRKPNKDTFTRLAKKTRQCLCLK
ncbi:hypothetical protein RYX36_024708 [Vicia faba]